MTNKKIMLVDDEERFLTTTRKLLEKRGYQIETATSGLSALEKLEDQDIQLIILDVKMPEMDGIATLKKIKRNFPAIEVIMLTGHATVENAVEGLRLGASDYLIKPVEIDDIVEKIETFFSKRQIIKAQSVRRKETYTRLRYQLFFGVLAMLLPPYALFFSVGYSWLNDICHILVANLQLDLFYGWMCYHSHIITFILMAIFFLIPIGLWFVANSLVQRVRIMAEKRDELQFQLFHASKLASIGELASGVAHEINNPLAIVVARCGIIQDLLNPEINTEQNPHSILEEVEIISQAAFRARSITRQLIDFGLKKDPKLVSCNVNEILDEIIDGIKKHDFQNSKITIIRDYNPALPPILLDEARIKQVLLNILNNANEAISGSGTITISTKIYKEYIEITIKDTGAGIPSCQLKDIFKPFFTTKQTGEGTGLSLSVSLSIIESHGGTIDVQSKEGAGSSFIISLPI